MQRAYRDHLRKYNKRNNTDLWKFFYWDFFHDGHVEKFSMAPTMRDVVLEIWSPNIKRILDDGYEYVNVRFICTFQDVLYFSVDHDPGTDTDFESTVRNAQFLAAEINSRQDLITRHAPPDADSDLSSLIIEFDGFVCTLVFSQVVVKATEPVAFSLMLNNGDFEVPLFKADQET